MHEIPVPSLPGDPCRSGRAPTTSSVPTRQEPRAGRSSGSPRGRGVHDPSPLAPSATRVPTSRCCGMSSISVVYVLELRCYRRPWLSTEMVIRFCLQIRKKHGGSVGGTVGAPRGKPPAAGRISLLARRRRLQLRSRLSNAAHSAVFGASGKPQTPTGRGSHSCTRSGVQHGFHPPAAASGYRPAARVSPPTQHLREGRERRARAVGRLAQPPPTRRGFRRSPCRPRLAAHPTPPRGSGRCSSRRFGRPARGCLRRSRGRPRRLPRGRGR